MKYKELKITVITKKEISVIECNHIVGKFISTAMAKNEELLEFHNANKFKNYCFDLLYPFNIGKDYLKNSMYSFRLRSIDCNFIDKIKSLLFGFSDVNFKTVSIYEKTYFQRPIKSIRALTPVVITFPKNKENKIETGRFIGMQDDVIKNLVTRYNAYTGKQVGFDEASDVFDGFEILSRHICPIKYKDITLGGMKVKAIISGKPLAQNLAFFAEATGLGEKSSACGAGFIHANYVKGWCLTDD